MMKHKTNLNARTILQIIIVAIVAGGIIAGIAVANFKAAKAYSMVETTIRLDERVGYMDTQLKEIKAQLDRIETKLNE